MRQCPHTAGRLYQPAKQKPLKSAQILAVRRIRWIVFINQLSGPGDVRRFKFLRRQRHLRRVCRPAVGGRLGSRVGKLPNESSEPARDQQPDDRGRRYRQAVPAGVFAKSVDRRGRFGGDRLVSQPTSDVGGQVIDGLIPLWGGGCQCVCQYCPQVLVGDLVAPDEAPAADRRTHFRKALAGQFEWPLARQDLKQNDAERVNVGRGRDVFAADLFRCGIVRRQCEAADRVSAAVRLDQLGDAKIQQYRRTVVADEYILRFEVAMYDQVLMGKADGVADLFKKGQLLGHRQPFFAAVPVNGNALDMFHHKERRAVRRRSAVE